MDHLSDYIIYVDESGDHGLDRIDPDYPIFSLVFCIFNKHLYASHTVPAIQSLKIAYWGHSEIVLHENDIRKNRRGDYAIFSNNQIRENFTDDFAQLINTDSFHITASVIKKAFLSRDYASNPYELSMLFCMERLHLWLLDQGQEGKRVYIFCESRGFMEDKELELEFYRICDNSSALISSNINFKTIDYQIRFLKKTVNSSGLQYADMVARPIGLSILRSEQPNKAMEVIKNKIIPDKKYKHYVMDGLKVFPEKQ